jgi:hypothetical protein
MNVDFPEPEPPEIRRVFLSRRIINFFTISNRSSFLWFGSIFWLKVRCPFMLILSFEKKVSKIKVWYL